MRVIYAHKMTFIQSEPAGNDVMTNREEEKPLTSLLTLVVVNGSPNNEKKLMCIAKNLSFESTQENVYSF